MCEVVASGSRKRSLVAAVEMPRLLQLFCSVTKQIPCFVFWTGLSQGPWLWHPS